MMATFNVTANVADGAAGSLRAAITAANSNNENDTINLAAGTYVLTQWLSLTENGKTITFQGDTAANTIVDANHTGRVFGAGYGVTAIFNDMTITNGGSDSSRPTGAGIDGYYATITVNDSIITGNKGYQGGGIYVNPGTLTVSNSVISDNDTTRDGGGVFAYGGTVTISNSTIEGNTAGSGYHGGGIYLWNATGSLSSVAIEDNAAGHGGGMSLLSGGLSVTGGSFTGNTASNYGGGLLLNAPSSDVTVSGATISDNSAPSGGGIHHGGGSNKLTITESTIAGNDATSSNPNYGEGGGIYTVKNLELIRSTVSGNTATNSGGGLYSNSTLTITNSTISGNSAATGGGWYTVIPGSSSAILNSTIASNSSSGAGGGMFLATGSVSMKNSILANNTAGSGSPPDFSGYSGSIASQGYNLFSASGMSTYITGTTTGNQLGVNPQLASLANNGGPTQTHALLSNSPAIDTGTSSGAPSVDQRNESRPKDGDSNGTAQYDIGAFEYVVTNPPPTADNDSYSDAVEDTTYNVSAANGVLNGDTPTTGLTAVPVTGSGKDPTLGTVSLNSDGSFTYTPTANKNGVDYFYYKAWNGTIYSNEAKVTITIASVNDLPVANADTYTLNEDATLNLITYSQGALGNDTDVESTTLTMEVLTYPPATAGTLTPNSNGTFLFVTAQDYHGETSFTYRAVDGNGGYSSSQTVKIIVESVEDEPMAFSDSYSLNEDSGTLEVDASAGVLENNDYDGDNDTLTAALALDGEGKAKTVKHGTLDFNSDGSFDYTPDADFEGTDYFYYIASDGDHYSDETKVTITVSPVNDPPIASGESESTTEDLPIYQSAPGVLANDTDIDLGDSLTVSDYDAVSVQGATVVVNSNGSYTYDPTTATKLQALRAEQSVEDSFTYTIIDSQGASAQAKVTITVAGVEGGPATSDGYYSVDEEQTLDIAAPGVLPASSDEEGDEITVEVDSGPSYGSLTLDSDGSFVYTPYIDVVGSDSFTYTATSGGLTSSGTVYLTINNINDAPTIASTPESVYVNENSEPSYVSLDGVFSDADLPYGDWLTLSIEDNTNSSLVAASIENGSLVLMYTADSYGSGTVTIRATDSQGEYAEFGLSVDVAIVNNPPTVADALLDLLVVTNAPPSNLSLDGVFSDADYATHGDWLTYSVTSGDTDLVTAAIVDGRVQLTYVADAFGVTYITVGALDNHGGYVEDEFKLTVGNSSQQEGEPNWGGEGSGGPGFAKNVYTGCGCAKPRIPDGSSDCPSCTKVDVFGLLAQGILAFANFVTDAVNTITNALTNPHPILSFDFTIPLAGNVPETIEAQVTMGSVVTTPVFYDTSGLDNGDTIRIDLLVDATELRTGNYEYTADFTMHFADTTTESDSVTGNYGIFNWAESPFGNRWWLADIDRLDVRGEGASWLRGNSTAVWFAEKAGGGYTSPDGNFSRLETLSNGWYAVIKPHGEQILFDEWGLMRMRQDRNGNSTFYAYYDVAEDDFADEIAFITDEYGRTTDFHYDEDGLVDTITDFAGRKTTFEYVAGRLVSVTGTDPDGTGPLAAPVAEFTHDSVGLIESATDAEGNVTTYVYDSYSRRLAGGTNPDGGTWSVDPQIVQGLVDLSTGVGTSTNPAAPTLAADAEGTFTDPNGQRTRSVYDSWGNPLRREDAEGNVYTWKRDEHGRATKWTLPDPDGDGPLEEIVYQGTCDVCGNRDYILYPDGSEEFWTYEHTFNQMTQHIDQLGRLTKFDIDEENGNLLAIRRIVGEEDNSTNEETNDILYSFDYTDGTGSLPAGLLVEETDALGRITKYVYQQTTSSPDFGRLIAVTMAFGTDDESTTEYEYDLAGNVTAIIDPLGRRTEMVYDALDRLTTIIGADPDGPTNPLTSPVTTFTYDAIGRLLTSTNPLGFVTTFDFDDEENTQTITLPDPDGAGPLPAPTSITKLDLAGNLTKLTDPLGRITELGYDKLDRPQTITLPDPDGSGELTSPVESTTYDNIGNVATTTDALGNTTKYRYDEMSRLLELTLPDPDGEGPLTAPVYGYTYFLDGQLKTSTDPLGRVTSYGYDEDLGWLTSVTLPDPDGTGGPLAAPVTSYEHDAVGNVTKVTEPGGAYTQYKFDNLNRLIQVTAPDPDGEGPLTSPITTYVYDVASQLTSVTDPLGRVTTYGHDNLGRQTSITLPDPDGPTNPLTSPVISYTYDAADRLLTSTDPLGNITAYAYDNLDRLLSVTQPDPDGPGGPLTAPVTSYTYNAASELLTITDPLGRVTTYVYDGLGRQKSITLPDPDGSGPLTSPVTSFTYDAASNLLTVTDPLLNVTAYGYDNLHRRTSVTRPDPDGEGVLTSPVYSYLFNAASELVSVTDPLSRVTAYTYDGLGRIDTLTLPDPDDEGVLASPVYQYDYDDALDLVAEIDPLLNVTAYAYDKLHRRTGVTQADPDGSGDLESPVWTYAFDAASQLTSQIDPLGRTTAYAFDNLGRLKTLTLPDPDGAGELTSPVTTYGYDAASNLTSVIDALGRVTAYAYDNLHRQKQVTLPDPDGMGIQTSPVWNYSYDAASQLVSQSDPLSRVTSYVHDNLGRLETITQPDPDDAGPLTSPVTTFAYDAASNVTAMTDARGYVTTYAYDDLYRRTGVTLPDPDGGGSQTSPVWSYTFDAANQLLTQTDPMLRTTSFTFDKLGRTTAVTQPDPDGADPLAAPVTAYGYDPVGNVLTVTDPLSHVTTYAYDNLYRRTSITDALSGVTSFTFDTAGQLLSLTDPVLNTTEWIYDGLGRVKEEKNQLDQSRFFQYDAVSNLTQRTDRNGRVIQYVYDGLNRNTDENWYEDSSLVHSLNFEFDAANQLLVAEDMFATNHFTYDKLGRVTQEVQTLAGFADTITLAQEFDALGNRTRAEMNYGTAATLATDYLYDGLSRMTQQTQYDSATSDIAWKRVTFQYNAASQFSQIERFVGNSTTPIAVATSTYEYDGIGRLQELLHFTDTTTWAGYEYEYDAASRITAIDSFVDGLTEYDYDQTNQLTGADHASLTDEAYEYDANGNREMSGYVIGDNNQLASDGTHNYAYDDEGNRISRTNISTGYVTTYTWDHRNRLIAVTELDDEETVLSTIEYSYDAFDRWISRTYDADGPGSTAAIDSYFAHDGDQVALEFEDATGSVDGGDLTHINSWGPVIDQLMADESFGEEPLWALNDHLETPRDLIAYDEIAEEAELRNHRIYDSFGNMLNQTSTISVTATGFTGRPFDSSSRMFNVRGRWLDSLTGAWLSFDRIGFAGRDANLQRYVGNSPLNYIDPEGTEITEQEMRQALSPRNRIIQRYGHENPYPNPTRLTITMPTAEEVHDEVFWFLGFWLLGPDEVDHIDARLDLEGATYGERADTFTGIVGARYTPGLETVWDVAELKTGECLITGRPLTDLEYTITLVMAFIPLASGGPVRRFVNGTGEVLGQIGETVSRGFRRRIAADAGAEVIERQARNTTQNIDSQDLLDALSAPNSGRSVPEPNNAGGASGFSSLDPQDFQPPRSILASPPPDLPPAMANFPTAPDPHVLRFATEFEEDLVRATEERMREVGVPEEYIGGTYNGIQLRAFAIQSAENIGGNMRPGTSPVPGIFVDQGVLNPCHGVTEAIPSWQQSRLVDRLDAAIAHEFEELMSKGFDPHDDAIINAPNTALRITDEARRMLDEYFRHQYPDGL